MAANAHIEMNTTKHVQITRITPGPTPGARIPAMAPITPPRSFKLSNNSTTWFAESASDAAPCWVLDDVVSAMMTLGVCLLFNWRSVKGHNKLIRLFVLRRYCPAFHFASQKHRLQVAHSCCCEGREGPSSFSTSSRHSTVRHRVPRRYFITHLPAGVTMHAGTSIVALRVRVSSTAGTVLNIGFRSISIEGMVASP